MAEPKTFFELADKHAAEQKAKDKRGPSKPKEKAPKSTHFREGRTTTQIVEDMQKAQSTDSNNE